MLWFESVKTATLNKNIILVGTVGTFFRRQTFHLEIVTSILCALKSFLRRGGVIRLPRGNTIAQKNKIASILEMKETVCWFYGPLVNNTFTPQWKMYARIDSIHYKYWKSFLLYFCHFMVLQTNPKIRMATLQCSVRNTYSSLSSSLTNSAR